MDNVRFFLCIGKSVRKKTDKTLLLLSNFDTFYCRKPVSYYLHVIDRTKLERYFQCLKTKGTDGKTTYTIKIT